MVHAQDPVGKVFLLLNEERFSFDQFSHEVLCWEDKDTLTIRYVAESADSADAFIFTGISLWIQSGLSIPQRVGALGQSTESADAEYQFTMQDLVPEKPVFFDKTAHRSYLELGQVLRINQKQVAEFIQLPKDERKIYFLMADQCHDD